MRAMLESQANRLRTVVEETGSENSMSATGRTPPAPSRVSIELVTWIWACDPPPEAKLDQGHPP